MRTNFIELTDDSTWAIRFVNKIDFKHYHRTEEGTWIDEFPNIELKEAKVITPVVKRKWSWLRSRNPNPDSRLNDPLIADPSSTNDEPNQSNGAGELTVLESCSPDTSSSASIILNNQIILASQKSNLKLHDLSLQADTGIVRYRIRSDDSFHEHYCFLDVLLHPSA